MSVELARDAFLLVAVLGLALPVGYAGLPVLGQGAFVGVGAFATALLGPGGRGWPLGLAVLAGTGLAGLAGAATAAVVRRLEGAAIGLATWALAWLGLAVLTAFPGLSGGTQGLVRPTPPVLRSPALGLELELGPGALLGVALVVAALTAAALARMERGPGGLDLAAIRESPGLARSLGVPVGRRRVAVLAVSGALGGFAGAGLLLTSGVIAAGDVDPLLSLQLLVAALAVPLPRWWAPLVGATAVGGALLAAGQLAAAVGADPARARGVVTALVLVTVLATRRLWRRAPRSDGAEPSPGAEAGARPAPAASAPAASAPAVAAPEASSLAASALDGPALVASGVSVSFGGLRALDGVDLQLSVGEVHALIGPNGSGKSTLLRILAGDLRPATGEVLIRGSSTAPDVRARVGAGVVRTPQATVLVPGAPVALQVGIGTRAAHPQGAAVLRHLLATPNARRNERCRRLAQEKALADCGLSARAGSGPEALATGEQRRLQVARAAATGAQVLLLDEPAAGMSPRERDELVAVVRGLAGNGAAVLLVEHDMALVNRCADVVTVLAAGRVIAVGPPGAIREDAAVQDAYLGATT